MNWRDIFKSKKKDILKELNQKIDEINRVLKQNEEQSNKISRVQYKTSLDLISKVTKMDSTLSEAFDYKRKYELEEQERDIQSNKADMLTEVLISIIDDIDSVYDNDDYTASWKALHNAWWDRISNALSKAGIFEIDVLGKTFDPSLAEAIDIIKREDESHINGNLREYMPYEVIKVLKRGYALEGGKILRKAKVITVKERV